MITFLAYYPQREDEKDGMMQRILNIDVLFKEHSRQYIDISFRRNSKKKCDLLSDNLIVYRVNIFLHFWFIIKLLKQSTVVYSHSIYNMYFFHILSIFIREKQNVYLDVHGVVPEENLLMRGKRTYYIYSIIEYFAFRLISGVIYVTNTMKKYYELKYQWSINIPNIVYNIYPNFSTDFNLSEQVDINKTVVVYSGNCQKWQNIDLMLEIIKNNRQEHIEYIIITGEPSVFEEKMKEIGIIKNLWNISVLSVKPSELSQYYSKAHYGFILRDDIIVNQVANPTKMLEYLSFGIIPIVKSPKIGDFNLYKYDYLLYTDFQATLIPKKSKRNIDIAKKIICQKGNLPAFVLEERSLS